MSLSGTPASKALTAEGVKTFAAGASWGSGASGIPFGWDVVEVAP